MNFNKVLFAAMASVVFGMIVTGIYFQVEESTKTISDLGPFTETLEMNKATLALGKPVSEGNLTIFPILSDQTLDRDDFITLDEGLRTGQVQVTELGTVEQVSIRNKAEKPLYIMPGEIISGGNQDRSIANPTIIYPGNQPSTVGVYCVEQGRWAPEEDAPAEQEPAPQEAVEGVDGLEVAEQPEVAPDGWSVESSNHQEAAAPEKLFLQSPGILSKRVRMSVQSRSDQSRIWDDVSFSNTLYDSETSTDTFAANYENARLVEQVNQLAEKFEAPIASQENVVGVVVVMNGKPVVSDVFGSTPMFQKLWPKLLRSYSLDAVGSKRNSVTLEYTEDELKWFLSVGAKGTVRRTELKLHQRNKYDVESFTSTHARYGGTIHKCNFAE